MSRLNVLGRLGHRLGLALTPSVEPLGQFGIAERKHARGEERGVDCAGAPDGKRPNWDARGHLHDGIERVDARERLRFDRHAEDRKRRQRRRHAGQVGGPARARDDDFEALRLGRFGEGMVSVGRK
jgi:hypothetical protein